MLRWKRRALNSNGVGKIQNAKCEHYSCGFQISALGSNLCLSRGEQDLHYFFHGGNRAGTDVSDPVRHVEDELM